MLISYEHACENQYARLLLEPLKLQCIPSPFDQNNYIRLQLSDMTVQLRCSIVGCRLGLFDTLSLGVQ